MTHRRQANLNATFRSLTFSNYRLFAASEAISRTGTWVYVVAENWVVVQLGGGGLAIGITTALHFAPILFLGPLGGTIADRHDKRSLLTLTQTLSGLVALSLGCFGWLGLLDVWSVRAAALAFGCVNAVDMPASQAFVVELVGEGHTTNAVALNSAVSTVARSVGPAIGGLLISVFGSEASFLVNGGSFLVVVLALRMMNTAELFRESPSSDEDNQPLSGLGFAWSHHGLRAVLLAVTVVSIFAFNFQVLLPLFAENTLQGGPGVHGLLMSSLGVGSLIGSLISATWPNTTVTRVSLWALGLGGALVAMGLAASLPTGLLGAGILGIMMGLFLTAASGYLLVTACGGMRGRVMALYSMAFLGTGLIGGPLIGWVADLRGPSVAFVVSGVACVLAAVTIGVWWHGASTGMGSGKDHQPA